MQASVHRRSTCVNPVVVLALTVSDVWICCLPQERGIPPLAGWFAFYAADHSATDVANNSFRNGRGSYDIQTFQSAIRCR